MSISASATRTKQAEPNLSDIQLQLAELKALVEKR